MATLGEKLAALERTVEAEARNLGEKVDKLDERLFGNGQPGVIKELQDGQNEMSREIQSLQGLPEHVKILHQQNVDRMEKIELRAEKIEKSVGGIEKKLGLLKARNLIIMSLLYVILAMLTGNGIVSLSNLLKILKAL